MYARSAAVALSLLVLLLPPLVHAGDTPSGRASTDAVDEVVTEPVVGSDVALVEALFDVGDPWGDLLVTCAEAAAKANGAETGLPECDDVALVEEVVPQLDGFLPTPGDPCAYLLDPYTYPGLPPIFLLAQYRQCRLQLSGDTDDGDCVVPSSDTATAVDHTTTR